MPPFNKVSKLKCNYKVETVFLIFCAIFFFIDLKWFCVVSPYIQIAAFYNNIVLDMFSRQRFSCTPL